jgi:hypothetical protein
MLIALNPSPMPRGNMAWHENTAVVVLAGTFTTVGSSRHSSPGPGSSMTIQDNRADVIFSMFDVGGWAVEAACRGRHDIPFFSKLQSEMERPAGQSIEAYLRPARNLCVECPVKMDCLMHAMAVQEHGIWAGTDFDERGRLRRVRNGSHPGWGPCPDCGSEWTLGSKSGPKLNGLISTRCIECNYRWDSHPIMRLKEPL